MMWHQHIGYLLFIFIVIQLTYTIDVVPLCMYVRSKRIDLWKGRSIDQLISTLSQLRREFQKPFVSIHRRTPIFVVVFQSINVESIVTFWEYYCFFFYSFSSHFVPYLPRIKWLLKIIMSAIEHTLEHLSHTFFSINCKVFSWFRKSSSQSGSARSAAAIFQNPQQNRLCYVFSSFHFIPWIQSVVKTLTSLILSFHFCIIFCMWNKNRNHNSENDDFFHSILVVVFVVWINAAVTDRPTTWYLVALSLCDYWFPGRCRGRRHQFSRTKLPIQVNERFVIFCTFLYFVLYFVLLTRSEFWGSRRTQQLLCSKQCL